ncbi:MAG: hypothetical protein M0019_05230 [Actinomycetota bacterium]|nr:hypothetical protein [Actinomycetota bacterium]
MNVSSATTPPVAAQPTSSQVSGATSGKKDGDGDHGIEPAGSKATATPSSSALSTLASGGKVYA